MQLTLLLEVSVSSRTLSSLIPSSLSFGTVFFFFYLQQGFTERLAG